MQRGRACTTWTKPFLTLYFRFKLVGLHGSGPAECHSTLPAVRVEVNLPLFCHDAPLGHCRGGRQVWRARKTETGPSRHVCSYPASQPHSSGEVTRPCATLSLLEYLIHSRAPPTPHPDMPPSKLLLGFSHTAQRNAARRVNANQCVPILRFRSPSRRGHYLKTQNTDADCSSLPSGFPVRRWKCFRHFYNQYY